MAIFRERASTLKALWTESSPDRKPPVDTPPPTSATPQVEKSLFRLTAELKNLLHRDRWLRARSGEAIPADDGDSDHRRDEGDAPEKKNGIKPGWKDRAAEFLPITPARKIANRLKADSKKG